ncbi:MAG TPA: CNNM domain-containing protein [Candidatus Udaeobacter sp.]|jgi:CBS domain containing-hemolysin-like protein|nr:CNNM domain-containing protein [Candidatus Udaeobacter sp.]
MIISLIIFCCWIVSFFFNGIESGLLSIDPIRLRQNVKRRVPAAVRLNRLLKRPERLLVTVLLITNAADILGLFLLTHELVRLWGFSGYFLSVAVALPVYLFLLSVLPKSLFRRFPFRALAQLGSILELASFLFSPLLELGARVGKLLLPERAKRRARLFAGREELKQITKQSELEGSLTATERVMIHNVVDFSGVKVRDVMLPRAKVVALSSTASPEEAVELGASSGFNRLPVITRAGQPAGLVNVLDILLDQNGSKPLDNYVRRLVTTGEQESAYRVVQQLRAARLGLAAVLDRKKNFSGIVTIEDLIRRLVSSSEAKAT